MAGERPSILDEGALAGIFVLDFTWVVAGPHATRLLAAWGAEVVRIEWPERPDVMRFEVAPPSDLDVPPHFAMEVSGVFNDLNANKASITLNMSDERGRALFERLLARADLVVENFSPAAMEGWGYDYDVMRAINPQVIYLSLSGYGHTGRSRYYLTYGPSAQALSGLTFASGLPGEEPAGWGFSYMDHIAGYTAAMAVVMALYERERTGEGQYLDLSQAEAGMGLTGAAFLDYVVNGRPGRRPGFPPGNRSVWPGCPDSDAYRCEPYAVPHNTYRCAGDDDNAWCVIVARTDDDWQTLVELVADPALRDARFATLHGRIEHQDEIDRLLESWTCRLDKYEVMARLQEAGVPCGAVQASMDWINRDPQLRARATFKELDHPALGRRPFQQVPVKMSATPPEICRSAPLIGSANEEVYSRVLGLTTQAIRGLVDDGVLWPRDMPRPPWIRGIEEDQNPETGHEPKISS